MADVEQARRLFACTMNAVRSPMAAAMLRHLVGREALCRIRPACVPVNSIPWPSK